MAKIKNFKNFINESNDDKNEIIQLCKKYFIENYTINNDMTIDVDGNLNLEEKLENLDELPIRFNEINGNFYCGNNNLKSLKGSPRIVNGDFDCSNNKLVTLYGAPENIVNKYMGGNFNCSYNNLTSLEHITKEVNDLNCDNNEIKTFYHFPKINGKLMLKNNPIEGYWTSFQKTEHIPYFNELGVLDRNGKFHSDRMAYFLSDVRE